MSGNNKKNAPELTPAFKISHFWVIVEVIWGGGGKEGGGQEKGDAKCSASLLGQKTEEMRKEGLKGIKKGFKKARGIMEWRFFSFFLFLFSPPPRV